MPVLSYVHNATWKEAWQRQGDNGRCTRSLCSGSLKIPIFSNRLSLRKDDISCGQHGSSRCFCVTTKDTTESYMRYRVHRNPHKTDPQ